jgi:hypothetical protein
MRSYLKTAPFLLLFVAVLFVVPFIPDFAQTNPPAPHAHATPSANGTVERCKLGVFLVDLNDLNVQKKSFDASFWLWTLCANGERHPLKTLEFVNGMRPNGSLDQSSVRNGVTWSSRKIEGSFRQDWDLRDFPFDRHVLRLTLEEGVDDSSAFQYEPDPASGYDKHVHLSGWRVTGFRIVPTERRYETTFGDPLLPQDASAGYSGVQAEISVTRASYTSFFKMASVVYVAATLALLSFLFHLDSPSSFGSRISFLAGSLFATVVNMRVASAELGTSDGLSMIDLIHITALLLVITATILTIAADRRLEKGKKETVRHFDLRNMIVCAVTFVVANIGLITFAAIRG